jgi:hypothetical protein
MEIQSFGKKWLELLLMDDHGLRERTGGPFTEPGILLLIASIAQSFPSVI